MTQNITSDTFEKALELYEYYYPTKQIFVEAARLNFYSCSRKGDFKKAIELIKNQNFHLARRQQKIKWLLIQFPLFLLIGVCCFLGPFIDMANTVVFILSMLFGILYKVRGDDKKYHANFNVSVNRNCGKYSKANKKFQKLRKRRTTD